MNVMAADPRQSNEAEFHFSEQPQLSEELRMLREQVRRFVEKEVMPNGEQWERDGKIPREIYRRMGALGFLGMRHAAEYGGTDMGPPGVDGVCRRTGPLELRRVSPRQFWCTPTCRRFTSRCAHAGAEAKISAGDHPPARRSARSR